MHFMASLWITSCFPAVGTELLYHAIGAATAAPAAAVAGRLAGVKVNE